MDNEAACKRLQPFTASPYDEQEPRDQLQQQGIEAELLPSSLLRANLSDLKQNTELNLWKRSFQRIDDFHLPVRANVPEELINRAKFADGMQDVYIEFAQQYPITIRRLVVKATATRLQVLLAAKLDNPDLQWDKFRINCVQALAHIFVATVEGYDDFYVTVRQDSYVWRRAFRDYQLYVAFQPPPRDIDQASIPPGWAMTNLVPPDILYRRGPRWDEPPGQGAIEWRHMQTIAAG